MKLRPYYCCLAALFFVLDIGLARAAGTGLISGRKAFQRPVADGVELLNAIQDVYLCDDVTVA